MADNDRRANRARRSAPDLRIGLSEDDLARFDTPRIDIEEIKRRSREAMAPLADRADYLAFTFVRIGLGIIYLWFGSLKLLPGVSPAESLVQTTLAELGSLFFGMTIPGAAIALLGFWEVGIGVCFLAPRLVRRALVMFALHIPATLLPMVLVPEAVWSTFPFALTMEGQYVVKNLSLIGGALFMAVALRRPAATAPADTRSQGPVRRAHTGRSHRRPERPSNRRPAARRPHVPAAPQTEDRNSHFVMPPTAFDASFADTTAIDAEELDVSAFDASMSDDGARYGHPSMPDSTMSMWTRQPDPDHQDLYDPPVCSPDEHWMPPVVRGVTLSQEFIDPRPVYDGHASDPSDGLGQRHVVDDQPHQMDGRHVEGHFDVDEDYLVDDDYHRHDRRSW